MGVAELDGPDQLEDALPDVVHRQAVGAALQVFQYRPLDVLKHLEQYNGDAGVSSGAARVDMHAGVGRVSLHADIRMSRCGIMTATPLERNPGASAAVKQRHGSGKTGAI